MISVIITLFNMEKYISECLESVLNQTYTNLEIIVVNDCSTDNSINIVNEYSKKDNRIIIINNKENLGAGMSRKIGINASKGNYVVLIDADDYITKNYLYDLHQCSIKNDSDIVCGSIYQKKLKTYSSKNNITNDEKISFVMNEILTFINNKLIKKRLWDKVEYCERRYIEDATPYYKLIYFSNKVTTCDSNEYYYYRENENSLTHKSTKEKNLLFKALSALDLYEFFKDTFFNKLFNKFFIRNQIGFFINDRKINFNKVKETYPKEYDELIERWNEIKITLEK